MFPFKAAYRFTIKNKLQNIIIFFAIVIGVGVQFFILTLSSVLKTIILDHALLYSPNISISQIDRKANTINEHDFLNKIVNDEEVETAFYINSFVGSISASSNSSMSYPFTLTVADNDDNFSYRNLYGVGIPETLKSGRLNDPTKKEIMLDINFANNIGAQIGDIIYFKSTSFNSILELTLTGTYETGLFSYTKNFTYIHRKVFTNYTPNKSSIIIKMVDPYKSTEFLEKISTDITDPLSRVTDWQDSSERILQMQTVQRAVIGVIEVLISIALFIVIFNMLNYIIQKKYKEIGILKASGMQNKHLQLVFLLQTLIVTLIATVIGLFLGRIAVSLYSKFMVDPTTNKSRFIFEIHSIDYISLFLLTMIVATLASVFSYRKTKNTSIVKLMRL